MRRFAPLVAALAGAVVVTLSAASDAAWVETRIREHKATIDVEREGSALVTHELVLGVRGGPLKSIEVPGVDPDAEPVMGATATPLVRYGVPTPIPLLVVLGDDGTLRIEVEHAKGLRSGSYMLLFRYKTQLLARDRIRRRGTSAEVEWVGPRFSDGIDVAKVVFRLPEGPTLPVLPTASDSDDTALMGSAFLSSVRRESGKVEVEIVRPHVARGEPAVWRVLASPKCFDGLEAPLPAVTANPRLSPSVERPQERVVWLGSALAIALLYGLLVVLKWYLTKRDAASVGAEARALLPLPVGLRAALSGASLAGASLLAAVGDHPTAAGLLLLASMLLAAVGAPQIRATPRGPGHWLALQDHDAFIGSAPLRAGRFLDAGTPLGLLFLCLPVAAAAGAAVRLTPHSPFHAVCLLLSLCCLLPIFGTGRGSEWPGDRASSSRRALAGWARVLRTRYALKVLPWARIPDGASEMDELRLLVRIPRARDGLVSVELGLSQHATRAGFAREPVILIRAREGSECHRAFARRVCWQRGRRADERVALLKPALPLRSVFLSLVAETVSLLTLPEGDARAARSAVGGRDTTKARIVSPAHAA